MIDEAVSVVINSPDLRDEVADVLRQYERACRVRFVHDGKRKPYIEIGWENVGLSNVIGQSKLDIPNHGRSVVVVNPGWSGWDRLDEANRRRVRIGTIRHEFLHAMVAMEHSDNKDDVSNGLGSIPKWFSPTEVAILGGWYGRHDGEIVPNWLDGPIADRKRLIERRARILANVTETRANLAEQRGNLDRAVADIGMRKDAIRQAVAQGQVHLEANLRQAQANAVERRNRIRREIVKLEQQAAFRGTHLRDTDERIAKLDAIIETELDRYN